LDDRGVVRLPSAGSSEVGFVDRLTKFSVLEMLHAGKVAWHIKSHQPWTILCCCLSGQQGRGEKISRVRERGTSGKPPETAC
jgi:hypothetical protein